MLRVCVNNSNMRSLQQKFQVHVYETFLIAQLVKKKELVPGGELPIKRATRCGGICSREEGRER